MKTKPTTILFDANSLMTARTGVGHYTARLVEHMAKNNPDIRFVGYYYNFLGRKQSPTSPTGDNVSYQSIYAFPGPLINLLRRFNIEIPIEVLTLIRADFVLYPNFLTQPSIFKTPNAPVIHDLVYLDFPEYGSSKSVRDLTRFVPRAIRRASFVMTVSQFSKQRIVSAYHIPADQVITTFIPPNKVVVLNDGRKDEILQARGITKPYIFFIGTMEPRKNIKTLLDAYAILPDTLRHQYSLVLAGKIDWKYQGTKVKIEQLQAAGHDIHYLGYVDDETQAALYQGARLFVIASNYEGFGMPILEALSYGVPCVASNISVFHEVGGDAITYFNQEEPVDIAATITSSLTNPVDPQALKEYVASRPQWDTISRSVVDHIQASIKKGKL